MCPTSEEAIEIADGDGFIELLEGAQTYGPVLLTLSEDIDPDGDGRVMLRKTYPIGSALLPLTNRHIVLHGKTVGAVGIDNPELNDEVNGTAGYKTLLPIACGEITAATEPMSFRKAPSGR